MKYLTAILTAILIGFLLIGNVAFAGIGGPSGVARSFTAQGGTYSMTTQPTGFGAGCGTGAVLAAGSAMYHTDKGFSFDTGSGSTTNTCIITLGSNAPNRWQCIAGWAANLGAPANIGLMSQGSGTTNTIYIISYTISTGALVNLPISKRIIVLCSAG